MKQSQCGRLAGYFTGGRWPPDRPSGGSAEFPIFPLSAAMHDMPPVFTQLDISATSIAPTHQAHSGGGDTGDIRQLLAEMVALQQRTCGLLGEMLAQVSLQQRQRANELKAWKEANPQLARSCRRAAESLAGVHTEFLARLAEEAVENAENFSDSEFALGEFIDRHGPRLAHFNGVLQLFSQLGAPTPAEAGPTGADGAGS